MKMWLNILGERSSADEKNKIESIASIKTVNCGGLFFYYRQSSEFYISNNSNCISKTLSAIWTLGVSASVSARLYRAIL